MDAIIRLEMSVERALTSMQSATCMHATELCARARHDLLEADRLVDSMLGDVSLASECLRLCSASIAKSLEKSGNSSSSGGALHHDECRLHKVGAHRREVDRLQSQLRKAVADVQMQRGKMELRERERLLTRASDAQRQRLGVVDSRERAKLGFNDGDRNGDTEFGRLRRRAKLAADGDGGDGNGEHALGVFRGVTSSLQRSRQLLASEIERALESEKLLAASSSSIRAVGDEHQAIGATVDLSSSLLGRLRRRDLTDKVLLSAGTIFFFLVVLYIIKSRVFS
jgi:Sec20